jgi:hypothetical protein
MREPETAISGQIGKIPRVWVEKGPDFVGFLRFFGDDPGAKR